MLTDGIFIIFQLLSFSQNQIESQLGNAELIFDFLVSVITNIGNWNIKPAIY